MAAEPITIYSSNVDPEGVLGCLRALAPDLKITGGPGGWSSITISTGRGLFRKPATLTFNHAQDYYAGEDFPKQMRGMQGYFSRFPANDLTPRIMLLIASFRFSVTLFPSPEPDLFLDSKDERLKYLLAVVRQLDGVIFTPSGLRDAAGRVLCSAAREPDPKAVIPAIRMQAPARSAMPLYKGGTAPNPPSPTASRVARRALCLAAVAWRGMLEREHAAVESLESARAEFLQWVEAVGIGDELEPDEWRLLQTPVGKGDSQEYMDAEWRFEGAALLGWAIGRVNLPTYDVQADVGKIGQALGLATPERGRSFLTDPTLRPVNEVEALSTQILGIHWRLRELRVRPGNCDFERKSQDAWFGKLPLEGIQFKNGDLAIGEYAVGDAPEHVLLPCVMTVQERHRAINWLCGDSPIYSQTDTPT
jgi:hypothetical protein